MNRDKFAPNQIILVTGATRSGKSEWAETLAKEQKKTVVYVATAMVDPGDCEWQARIERHRLRRPRDWQTLQVPLELPQTLKIANSSDCLLIDSLGTWVANCLDGDDAIWEKTAETLLECLQSTPADVILVAEEVGWGVVPAYKSGRQFRDRLGNLVRQIGAIANPVYLVTGGRVLNLSLLGEPLRDYS